jgi:Ribbon-helix-helix protein, copG family
MIIRRYDILIIYTARLCFGGVRRTGPLPERITIPVSQEVVQQIDQWRRQQRDLPNRSEAIRRMIDYCLKNTPQLPM